MYSDIKQAVKDLQKYWNTYSEQRNYERYSTETLIDDALYGLGIAIDKEQYEFAQGYDKFKQKLLEHLSQ